MLIVSTDRMKVVNMAACACVMHDEKRREVLAVLQNGNELVLAEGDEAAAYWDEILNGRKPLNPNNEQVH